LMSLLQVSYKQPTHNHFSATNLQEDEPSNYYICELQSHLDGLKCSLHAADAQKLHFPNQSSVL